MFGPQKPLIVVCALTLATPLPAASAVGGVQEQRLTPSQARGDFQHFYRSLQEAHINLFARVSKPEYDRLYERTLSQIRQPASKSSLGLRFQRFAAFGRIAHSRIDANYRNFANFTRRGGKSFPLAVRVKAGKTYITDNRSGIESIHRGDEITHLNDQPVEYWLSRCGRNLSADTPYMSHALMELDFPMLLWLELGPRDHFTVTVRRTQGAARKVGVPARNDAEMKIFASRQAPMLHLDGTARIARMLDGKVAYLRPGGFYNSDATATNPYDTTGFRAFIDSAFHGFLAAGAKSLLIDLRENPGGDSSFSDIMVEWFATRPFKFASSFRIRVSEEAIASNAKRLKGPSQSARDVSHQFAALYASARPGDVVLFPIRDTSPRAQPRFTGTVYLLINRNCYSNCVAVAATVQDYHLGKVLGEETSDLATTYGAMETFTLANSGLEVGFPKAYIVRPNGGQDARGVVPDSPIDTPLIEGPADPMLQRALAMVRTDVQHSP